MLSALFEAAYDLRDTEKNLQESHQQDKSREPNRN
jgi:hypothetical protein